MKITILGAGNIGTAIAAYLSTKEEYEVHLYTNRNVSNIIDVEDTERNENYQSGYISISNDLQIVLQNADYVFITYPSQILYETFLSITKFLTKNTKIVVVPGTGGVEFYSHLITSKECTLVGLQRVPAICRLKKYGKSVRISGWKNQLNISCIPLNSQQQITDNLTKMFNINTIPVGKYYNVTLTPSNPILHTARLYRLFNDFDNEKIYPRRIKFYEEWDNFSSEILIKCDTELQTVYKIMSNNDDKVISLLSYYDSFDANSLTKKIKSIKAFQGIYTPMVARNSGFIPDLSSRYFTEDFPFGLCIIKGLALIYKIETPTIDTVIRWMQNLYNKEYISNSGNLGLNYLETAMPQRFKIDSVEKIKNIYKI
jgi:hypothetical protein